MTRVTDKTEALLPPVSWRGHTALYTESERQIVRQLPVREQFIVHTLKAFTDGEIAEPSPIPTAALVASDGSAKDPYPIGCDPAAPGRDPRGVPQGAETAVDEAPVPVYTDPEDIPFGEDKPKRRPKLYAVAWTWRKHKTHKTKKRCEERLRVWKKWYERQGWKVQRMGSGYWATLDGETHVIQLHEYDKETKKRL